jgi:hypothetical protein
MPAVVGLRLCRVVLVWVWFVFDFFFNFVEEAIELRNISFTRTNAFVVHTLDSVLKFDYFDFADQ